MKKHLVVIFSALLIYSCDSMTRNRKMTEPYNLKSYFYSLTELDGKQVYCYDYKTNGKSFTSYEVLWAENKEGKNILHMEAYTPTLQPTDYFVFELVDSGVVLNKHIQRKRLPQVAQEFESEIISNTVMKWNDYNTYSIEYHNAHHNASRERKFEGKVNEVKFNGQKYRAIKFLDVMTFEKHKTHDKGQLERIAIYCKDIGLYSCIYKYNDGRVYEKKLKEIIGYDEWLKR